MYKPCWTTHHNYGAISALGDAKQLVDNKEAKTAIQGQINDLFDEVYLDGHSLDGGEPNYEVVQKALEEGYAHENCYIDAGVKMVNDKLVDWDYNYDMPADEVE